MSFDNLKGIRLIRVTEAICACCQEMPPRLALLLATEAGGMPLCREHMNRMAERLIAHAEAGRIPITLEERETEAPDG